MISIHTTDKKQYFTHISLLPRELQEPIKALNPISYQRGATLLIGFALMEAVNRIHFLKTKSLAIRTAIVLLPSLFAYKYVGPKIYWRDKGEKFAPLFSKFSIPLYKNFNDVPNLEKAYFFLDDDNGFAPSLVHHSR